MKERVGSTVEKGKDLFEQKKSVIASAIDAGKEAYEKKERGCPRAEHE